MGSLIAAKRGLPSRDGWRQWTGWSRGCTRPHWWRLKDPTGIAESMGEMAHGRGWYTWHIQSRPLFGLVGRRCSVFLLLHDFGGGEPGFLAGFRWMCLTACALDGGKPPPPPDFIPRNLSRDNVEVIVMGADNITSLGILPDSEEEELKWLRAWEYKMSRSRAAGFGVCFLCACVVELITRRQITAILKTVEHTPSTTQRQRYPRYPPARHKTPNQDVPPPDLHPPPMRPRGHFDD